MPSVAVVVCHRREPEVLRQCIQSVRDQVGCRVRLIIVDDHSGDPLDVPAGGAVDGVEVLTNERWLGYTRSANRGMRHFADGRGDIVVLLNSDTVLPRRGLAKLRGVLVSAAAGVCGPLSNAASWQSLPQRWSTNHRGWSTNPGVGALDVEVVDRSVEAVGGGGRPMVPLLNGFCLAIRRDVFDAIGFFDEAAFPIGYGEENDFCFRATDAGFRCVVADDVYVYHAKSKSFGNLRRWWYSRRGGLALRDKWGQRRIDEACAVMRDEPTLAHLRRAVAGELERRGHGPFSSD